jgi:hypothetical protein
MSEKERTIIDWNIFMPDKMIKSYIVLPDGKMAWVSKYKKVTIEYVSTIRFYNDGPEARRKETEYPLISYMVDISTDEDKKILGEFFRGLSTSSVTLAKKTARYKILPNYVFPCLVEAVPEYFDSEFGAKFTRPRDMRSRFAGIRIELTLDDTNFATVQTIEQMNKNRKQYLRDQLKRFELLDI